MERTVLLISNTNDFMFNAVIAGLKRENFRLRLINAQESAIRQAESAPGIWILYLDARTARDTDMLKCISETLAEHQSKLFLIGNQADIDEAKKVIPGQQICREFVRPLNILELAGELKAVGGEEPGEEKTRILVVDDDPTLIRMTSRLLSDRYTVFLAGSGSNALTFLSKNDVDLILLDIMMPEMDGFETAERIHRIKGREKTPVIFLTADDDTGVEIRGLEMGAVDFIRKPFSPEVLLIRVENYIELQKLRRSLSREVEKQTEEILRQQGEIRSLTIQIVETLSGTIDAKDKYTNGHSTRVAEYSREIARRAGYGEEECSRVYMIGLLHDVGKIGIPNAIINKPERLTDEEYAIIKTHPGIGAEILKKITALPHIADGAHWHHERYDGKGYPDGLKGEEIPQIAQIIGVADAYDAMTSNRSYRGIMPQERVRSEIMNGRGGQFAPRFADIMLQMIDEDTEYQMHEQ